MADWIDKKNAIVADTVYDNGVLVARDVAFTLPGWNFETADVQAMGTMSVPIVGRLEDAELKITKIGIDMGLGRMSAAEKHNFEFRWVQQNTKADGTTGPEGCKAFVRTMPKGVGEQTIEPGSSVETEMTYGVTRQQIFCGGKEHMLIDRLARILRFNGKDYMAAVNKLL